MIKFVNAKVNIGLNIVGKREDGYHLLETVFLPVGVNTGTPRNPEAFNDMLELTSGRDDKEADACVVSAFGREQMYESRGITYLFSGDAQGCEPEKNLVVKAAEKFLDASGEEFARWALPATLRLYKKLPQGAGMGGGSADATFTLVLLNELAKRVGVKSFSDDELERIAVKIGADCPVFVRNEAAYAEGIGAELQPMPELMQMLKGKWVLVVKPDIFISTKEAFAGVKVKPSEFPLREIVKLPISEWKSKVNNDFEDSLFPRYPILQELKELLYATGAEYASMTGSGAALYGIYPTREAATQALATPRLTEIPYKSLILI